MKSADNLFDKHRLLVTGMVSARSVNLSHIACERPGAVQIASTYRRLQRFFQHADLGANGRSRSLSGCSDLGDRGTWRSTGPGWQIGGRDVNFLVLAVVTPRFRVPVMWSVSDGRGCSNTAQRIALMRRYIAAFDASTIRLLLGTREFIGNEWLKFLNDNNVPFAIRLKGQMCVTTGDGHTLWVHADGYAGFNGVFGKERASEMAFMSHVRRERPVRPLWR
jgi:hypothetical protein